MCVEMYKSSLERSNFLLQMEKNRPHNITYKYKESYFILFRFCLFYYKAIAIEVV